MIRIASLVSYQIMPAKMGGQKGIYLFLRYLSKHLPVVCYTTSNNVPSADEPFVIKKVLGTKKNRYINLFYFFKLRKQFKNDNITHLLLEQPYYGWLAYLLKKTLNIKLIIHSHNIEALRFKSTGKWWWRSMAVYEKWIHRKADYNFFISAEDMAYALQQYKLNDKKCAVITYGTERSNSPTAEEIIEAKAIIEAKHAIPKNTSLLLFNGTLNYPPNQRGLDAILNTINPQLLQKADFPYRILICGSRLPEVYKNLEDHLGNNIIYAGFVDDIVPYFIAADIFINPVCEGGGIKTKLVESLAAGSVAVSYEEGSIGVPKNVAGEKLIVITNNNTDAFTEGVLRAQTRQKKDTPDSFYNYFFWEKITLKAAEKIKLL